MKSLFLLLIILICIRTDQTNYSVGTAVYTTVRAVSSDGNALYVAGSNDLKVYRYNYTLTFSLSPTSYTPGHLDGIQAIAVSPGGKYVATGSADYSVIVADSYTYSIVCSFTHHNQVKDLVFDPTDDEVLYSGAVDDSIRKWAINNCSTLSELDVSESISSLGISPDGAQIIYGTLYGKVGVTDSSFSSFTTSSAHEFTVLDIMYTNSQYYVTVGQDALIILWQGTSQVTTYPAAMKRLIKNCDLFVKAEYNSSYRAMTCLDENLQLKTFKITNSTITLFSSHRVSKSNARWVVGKQLDGVQMLWTIAYNNEFYSHLIYDDSSGSCSPHFGEDTPENVCKFCFYMMDGCHFCNDENTCTTCSTGTYKSSSLCYKCPDSCSSCSNAGSCSTCAVGYEKSGSSCNAQPANGCFQYRDADGRCNYAANGYYLQGQIAYICSNKNTNCLECEQSGGNCNTCETGYYVSSNSCSSCSTALSGCLACYNQTICLSCPVAYMQNGSKLQCSNCSDTCQGCGYYYDECSGCNSTQNRELSGTSCVCKDSYYDPLAVDSICVLCSTVLTECYNCNNNTVCTECNPHFFFVTSGGKTQCELCNEKCQTCSGTSTNCSSCNSLTYNRVLSGTTCVCDTGYIEVNGSTPCLSCDSLNDGCTDCVNETYCSTCGSGYYLNVINGSYQICASCPYYCSDCTTNASNNLICSSCPNSTHRTLVAGMCECDTGYFDDNRTTTCEDCSTFISGCQDCEDRRSCADCGAGLYKDASSTLCTSCKSTCLTCGTYYDECASCDSSSNRILLNNSCVCDDYSYEDLNTFTCVACSSSLSNCASCESSSTCLGCLTGYTLTEDLTCLDCSSVINGCTDCTSQTNCTDCKGQFTLINGLCRCPASKFTSNSHWGECVDYLISGMQGRLDMEWQIHQHQNNSLTIFIRFRAKQLYVLSQQIEQSISLFIEGEEKSLTFDRVENNKIQIRTEINKSYYNPSIRIVFAENVFYNELLLTLSKHTYEKKPARIYLYPQLSVNTFTHANSTTSTTFYVLKWLFLLFLLIGLGHYLFEIVVFLQIMPLFLMLNMSLPSNLSFLLQGMLSFQVKSVIPILSLNSEFFVLFPHLTYDYYDLYDFFVLCKLGDVLVLILLNLMTKFSEGFVRMFPSGKVRRTVYQMLIRRGYSVLSLGILAFQPSFLVLCGVHMKWAFWESIGEILNYCSMILIFGFFIIYNFNHFSNLHTSKQIRNIDTENCYLHLNPQASTAEKVMFLTHLTDMWLCGALFIVTPLPYFIISFLFLIGKIVVHINPELYKGKIHFGMKISEDLMYLAIYVLFFVFYLAESNSSLTLEKSETVGICLTIMIILYLVFLIVEKIIVKVYISSTNNPNKVDNDFEQEKLSSRMYKNSNKKGHSVIFAEKMETPADQQSFGNTGFDSNFIDFFNKRPENYEHPNRTHFDQSLNENFGQTTGTKMTKLNESSFSEDKKNLKKTGKSKNLNTSKYAQHHLELKYQRQNATLEEYE